MAGSVPPGAAVLTGVAGSNAVHILLPDEFTVQVVPQSEPSAPFEPEAVSPPSPPPPPFATSDPPTANDAASRRMVPPEPPPPAPAPATLIPVAPLAPP